MARILCVWELGADLGHLSHLRLPIATALQLGHEVYLAARQLKRARDVLGDMPIVYLQAPFKQDVAAADQSAFLSYTHLLVHQCFSGVDELEMHVRAWRALFELVRPDLVLFEHSPTALIAAHAYSFKKVLVGHGFSIPPLAVEGPFAPFVTTPRTADFQTALQADDAVLLQVINLALHRLGAKPLGALTDIYAQADEQFLMTLPALDQFGERAGQHYLGVEPPQPHSPPPWPTGAGPKVFAYLHAIPALERLLKDLHSSGVCALLFIRGLPPDLRSAYTSEHIRFIDQPVDLGLIAQQAAWVISHGNHNTVATFMRLGIPQLLIPLHQEHLFAALRLKNQGCALMAYQDQSGFLSEISALQADRRLRQRAAEVAALCPSAQDLDAAGFILHTLQTLLSRDAYLFNLQHTLGNT